MSFAICVLKVLTKRSVSPLDSGCNVVVRTRVMPFVLLNVSNSTEMNCGPLSDTTVAGNPSMTKILARACIVAEELVEAICETYGNPVLATTKVCHM